MSQGANHGDGHEGEEGGHAGAGQERWLLTYADLITLLMVFFIVLYSMAQVDKAKYAGIARGLNQAFGGGNMIISLNGVGDGASVPLPKDLVNRLNSAGKDGQALSDPLVGLGEVLYADFMHDGRFTVRISERGLIISLAGNAAFDSGSDEIKPEFRELLSAISQQLKGMPNDISVEGFTDSDPIHNARFPSNWYLSVARANAVRDYMEGQGINPERMIVVGYGETRPIWSNSTPEGKAKNRRVDIVVLRTRQVIDIGREIQKPK